MSEDEWQAGAHIIVIILSIWAIDVLLNPSLYHHWAKSSSYVWFGYLGMDILNSLIKWFFPKKKC